MAALHLGLLTAIKYANDHPEITQIHFFADNTSAIKTIFDPMPKSGQLYSINFHAKACAFLDANPIHEIHISWSPGHCKITGNERADELAKGAVELESREPGSRAHAQRKAKEKVKSTWVGEWRKSNHTGRFAAANRIAPSLKPTERFEDTPREVFGRLIQCRTGHGYIGEYYSKFVPLENTDCPCGDEFQTREHILRECPRYEDQRYLLTEVSRDISLPDILGTKDGIVALTEFLTESGAFTKTGRPRQKRSDPLYEDEPDVDDSDSDSEDEDHG